MKKIIISLFIIFLITCACITVNAQPDPGSGGGGSPVGGGAPVGSGVIGLICLGISYGLFKMHKQKTRTP